MKEKNVLGVLSVVTMGLCPPVGIGFLALTGWTYYEEYKYKKKCDEVMRYLIDSNSIGLRSVVGDEQMGYARDLINK